MLIDKKKKGLYSDNIKKPCKGFLKKVKFYEKNNSIYQGSKSGIDES